jgi:CheY-like chemotaxis protein
MRVEPVELNGALASLLAMLQRLLGEHITLQLESAAGPLWIETDPGLLDQAVMNLCVNARDAMPNGGHLSLVAQAVELDADSARTMTDARPGRFVCLSVSDTGSGMTPETLAHLFEPFFTTKEVGKGTGLGLASVHGIVHQNNGWINVESTLGRGSTFRMYFPILTQPAAPAAVAGSTAPWPRGCETILLVEDETIVRQIATTLLQRLGYRVLAATDGPHALRLWAKHSAEIDLLFSDMVMPGGLNGRQLADQLRLSKPDLKILLASGYSNVNVDAAAGDDEDLVFLAKPFESDLLAATVRRCLDGVPPVSRTRAG